jgi:DNA-binding transcriptional ArsR family regulator
VSQHLRALRHAGLVIDRAQGRNVFYRAQPAGLAPLVAWMGHYGVLWRDQFANLHDLLKEIDP